MKSKKGQLETILILVSTLVIVGILLVLGYILNDQFKEEVGTESFSVTNLTDTYINSTGYTIPEASYSGFNDFTLTEIFNGTLGSGLIASTNYTASVVDGVIYNSTNDNWNNVSLSYTFSAGEESYKSIENTSDSIDTFVDLLPLVILIVLIGVILIILFGVIPGGRNAKGA